MLRGSSHVINSDSFFATWNLTTRCARQHCLPFVFSHDEIKDRVPARVVRARTATGPPSERTVCAGPGSVLTAMYGRGRGGRGTTGGRGTKNTWVRPGGASAAPASSKPASGLDAGAKAFSPPKNSTPVAAKPSTTQARDPNAFLPVGVKRKPAGELNPSAKKFRPDSAATKAAAERAAAAAELAEKIAAAKAKAEQMKASIQEKADLAKRRKEQALKDAAAKKELDKKQAALAKQERQRAASNLLSGFEGARQRTGVGTASGSADAAKAVEELTPEELDRIAVRRVMMAASDWAVLDLAPNSAAKWVKQSYRDLARRLHPDKCKAPGAKDAFQKLAKAYQNVSANL